MIITTIIIVMMIIIIQLQCFTYGSLLKKENKYVHTLFSINLNLLIFIIFLYI